MVCTFSARLANCWEFYFEEFGAHADCQCTKHTQHEVEGDVTRNTHSQRSHFLDLSSLARLDTGRDTRQHSTATPRQARGSRAPLKGCAGLRVDARESHQPREVSHAVLWVGSRPGWSTPVKSAAAKAASKSPSSSGWAPSGSAFSWELPRAARRALRTGQVHFDRAARPLENVLGAKRLARREQPPQPGLQRLHVNGHHGAPFVRYLLDEAVAVDHLLTDGGHHLAHELKLHGRGHPDALEAALQLLHVREQLVHVRAVLGAVSDGRDHRLEIEHAAGDAAIDLAAQRGQLRHGLVKEGGQHRLALRRGRLLECRVRPQRHALHAQQLTQQAQRLHAHHRLPKCEHLCSL
eukprot:scaffold63277_cov63-Phaeocystis_antarctica.AAC.3